MLYKGLLAKTMRGGKQEYMPGYRNVCARVPPRGVTVVVGPRSTRTRQAHPSAVRGLTPLR